MAQIVQLRCASCLKLLVKYDKREDKVIYKADGLYESGDKDRNAMFLMCPKPKCNTMNKITPKGLIKVSEDEIYAKQT